MSSQTKFPKVELLGVEVDAVTINQAVGYIIDRSARHNLPAGYVVKPYVEFLDRAARDPRLRALLNGAELSLPDGVSLLWAAHYLYAGRRAFWRVVTTGAGLVFRPGRPLPPLPQKFAGVNFTWPLLQAAATAGRSVFLVGHPLSGSIDHSRAVILRRLPNLRIVGALDSRDPSRPAGQVSPGWLDATAAAIRAANPDIILIGMGFPLQEQTMAALAPHLNHGLLIGEGGTFDYTSFGGRRRKAPRLFQLTGTEWLWRLILEPRRLRRQLAIPRFVWRVWRAGREITTK